MLFSKKLCHPVFLDTALKAKFFTYYENVLYPFFHNFVSPTDTYAPAM